jgi:hypothetical protein
LVCQPEFTGGILGKLQWREREEEEASGEGLPRVREERVSQSLLTTSQSVSLLKASYSRTESFEELRKVMFLKNII